MSATTVAHLQTLLIYLAAPTARTSVHTVLSVVAALTALGFLVAVPSDEEPTEVDLDALRAADVVVVMPGAEQAWEVTMAPILGKPVRTLDDFASVLTE